MAIQSITVDGIAYEYDTYDACETSDSIAARVYAMFGDEVNADDITCIECQGGIVDVCELFKVEMMNTLTHYFAKCSRVMFVHDDIATTYNLVSGYKYSETR